MFPSRRQPQHYKASWWSDQWYHYLTGQTQLCAWTPPHLDLDLHSQADNQWEKFCHWFLHRGRCHHLLVMSVGAVGQFHVWSACNYVEISSYSNLTNADVHIFCNFSDYIETPELVLSVLSVWSCQNMWNENRGYHDYYQVKNTPMPEFRISLALPNSVLMCVCYVLCVLCVCVCVSVCYILGVIGCVLFCSVGANLFLTDGSLPNS